MQVKLVGSTISCEPFFESADKSKDLRQNPHVQSYVIATDKVCLAAPRVLPWAPTGILHSLLLLCRTHKALSLLAQRLLLRRYPPPYLMSSMLQIVAASSASHTQCRTAPCNPASCTLLTVLRSVARSWAWPSCYGT